MATRERSETSDAYRGSRENEREAPRIIRSVGKHRVDIGRLCESVRASRRMMKRARQEFAEATRRLAGSHYSDAGTAQPAVIPLLSMFMTVMKRSLISQNPRVTLSTTDRSKKVVVAALERWANAQIERMRLGDVLQDIAGTALCHMGIAMIHLAAPWDAARLAWKVETGDPIVSEVDPEDFVIDMQARRIDEAAYMGNRIRVPMFVIENYKKFGKHRKELETSSQRQYDEDGIDLASSIARGHDAGIALDPEDMVELWYVYYARERTMYMFTHAQMHGCSACGDEPFHEFPWVGPERGPYEILGFETIPSNLLPIGPLLRLLDLDEACNTAARKLWAIIHRMKECHIIDGSMAEVGDQIASLNDGDIRCIPGFQAAQTVVYGGQHAQLVDAIMRTFRELFSFSGGNLELLGGRRAMAGTARQELLLQENAAAGVADLQDRTLTFVTRVLDRMIWYWWKHPRKVMETHYAPGGLEEFAIPMQIYPGLERYADQPLRRDGDVPDVRCDPYSLRRQSPQQKAELLREFLTNMYAPLAQMFEQQGVRFDLRTFAEKMGQYADSPDLAECLQTSMPIAHVFGAAGLEQGVERRTPSAAARSPNRQPPVFLRMSEAGPQAEHNLIAAAYNADNSPNPMGGNPNPQEQ